MTTREYYAHCRTLANGRIGASDCLRMAREAAHADREAAMRRYTPGAASWERFANEQPLKLSFSIKVY